MMMPSAIAARMYCVNLFDIEDPHYTDRFMMSQILQRRNTLGVRALLGGCSRCETSARDLAFTQRTTNAACTFSLRRLHQ
jgi:hypothetical protein